MDTGVLPGFSGSKFKHLFSFIWRESRKAKKEFLMIKAWNEWAEGNVRTLLSSQKFCFRSDS